jgi:acyl-coenzyme A synthetase/AMP-(fatty) acid ligase
MLDDVTREALLRHADRAVVEDRHGGLTYRELDRSVTDLSGSLPGGRAHVALYATNSVAYITTYLAVLRAGAVPFLIDSAMGESELTTIVGSCSIGWILHDRALPASLPVQSSRPAGPMTLTRVADAGERTETLDTTEVCRFTSGSTGVPNCIEFSGSAVTGAARGWVEGTGLTGADRILCFAGLTNGLAFNTSLLPAFLAGASLYVATGLPTASRVVSLMTNTAATRLTGFPALYDSIAQRASGAAAFTRLRLAISSGARLNPATAERLRLEHGVTVSDYYGIAETGPVTFARIPGPGLGTPLPGAEVRAGKPGTSGEILVRTVSMGSRYLNAPGVFEERIDADGFYHTGDNGYIDDGHLVLTRRTPRYLNVSGRKVDPTEIRNVVCGEPGVRDAMVFAIATASRDDVVVALVAADSTVTAAAVQQACRRALAPYKIPERVKVVPALPVTGIGKPRSEAARRLFEQDIDETPKG